MTFAAPASPTENVKVADLVGQLLIIEPLEYKTGIPTSLGEAEAIAVNLVNLDKGSKHDNVLFFNVALRNSLKSRIGQKVLARIGTGQAKPGKSAPYILVDASTDAAAVAKATAFVNSAPAPVASAVAPSAPAPAGTLDPAVLALLEQLNKK